MHVLSHTHSFRCTHIIVHVHTFNCTLHAHILLQTCTFCSTHFASFAHQKVQVLCQSLFISTCFFFFQLGDGEEEQEEEEEGGEDKMEGKGRRPLFLSWRTTRAMKYMWEKLMERETW